MTTCPGQFPRCPGQVWTSFRSGGGSLVYTGDLEDRLQLATFFPAVRVLSIRALPSREQGSDRRKRRRRPIDIDAEQR
jgi:hypothetical protein